MDRSRIEDKGSEKSNKRLTPGKFTESAECETNSVNSQKSYEEPKEDTFYIYSGSMDTNSIWNSTSDYKKSSSVLSNSLTNNQDSLNSIWSSKYNSNESLTKQDDHCQLPPISIDINEFELHENNYSSVISDNSEIPVNQKDLKENISVEDRKKITAMINSHDGWGVKPINQNTPWLFPDNENDGDNYPDTFSTWLNDSPNGAYAWEATKKQSGPDWGASVKGKSYQIPPKQTMWSSGGNESIWGNSNVYNNCGNVTANKIKPNVLPGFTALDTNKANFMSNNVRTDRPSRTPQDQMKNSCWSNDVTSRQMNEFKSMYNSVPADNRYTNQRSKPNVDSEMQAYKQCKDLLKQIIEQYQKEQRKIQESDNNLNTLGKLPESQSRAVVNELFRQRQATQQRMQTLRTQHDAILQKLNMLEEIILNFQRSTCGTVTPVDKQFSRQEMAVSSIPVLDLLANKLGSMQVQSSQDFRLDVPEFIPGKKWHGIPQNGKENRNPTVFNKICSQYSECNEPNQEPSSYPLIWLFIQNLPSHVTMEMIQSFFIQSNNPCIMPIHSNPFSRWMLIRFPNPFSSQKALQLLSGKIGQSTLISDQDANIKLQELKGVMAKFVAH